MITPRLQTIQDLFGDRIHYRVPIYQRPYVWDEEEQWLPLWQDIEEVARRRIASPDVTTAHFLGAFVIELESAEPGRVREYVVIDGQQRLTTLQVLLAALQDVTAASDTERAEELDRLLRNTGRYADGDLGFKVLPGRHDRPAFRATVAPAAAGRPSQDDGIPGAFAFFRGRFEAWLADTDVGDGPEQRLDAVQDVVEGLLQMVSIQLDGSTDAQVVFETLNSRGADLTSLDLAKNTLLRQAEREGVNVEEIHDSVWEPALGDADYWLEPVRQGRYTRERADLFLMHWLMMRVGKPPRVQHLFADFRSSVLGASPPPPAEQLVRELCRDATTYRSFDDLDATSVDGQFFRRLELMDTTTLIPVALLLFRPGAIEPDRRARALRALESWIVRRMLMGATAQAYNRLVAALVGRLNELSDLAQADDAIIDQLRGFDTKSDRWPADDEVRARLLNQPVYYSINQRRIRMLLEACEYRLADSNKSERLPIPDGLTIEHAMPHEWPKHWPLPADIDPEQAAVSRDARVDRLGNLTLVTQPLNSSLSNAAWSTKRIELRKRSQLLVNQHLCANDDWDESAIDTRGADLAAAVLETWPGPASDW